MTEMEAVLFDMDDVLVDVSRSYMVTIRKSAEHFLGRKVTQEEVERYKMEGGYNDDWDLTEAIVRDTGLNVPRSDMVQKFQDIYRGPDFSGLINREKWLLKDKVLNTLAARYLLGIVTGRPREEAEYTLDKFGAREKFKVLIAMEEQGDRKKPDPLGIQLALGTLGVEPGDAIYLGDNVDDVRAAAAAKVMPIGITNGSDKMRITLRKEGAIYVLESVNDILEVME